MAYNEATGYMDGVSGSDFANEMEFLSNYTKKINVRINSGGGTVLDGYAIYASIVNSKVPCHTYIDGIAASAAAFIAVAGKKCYMADYAMMMIHNAVDTQGDTDKKIMDLFNESVATMLSNRTGKTKEEIAVLMAKETWMKAEDAMVEKMIDEVYSTEKKMKAPKVTNVKELELIYNEILNPKIENEMKEIAKILGLPENATELQIANAINEERKKNSELANRITALENEKSTAEITAKANLKTKAEKLANDAVEAGKIKEEEKAEYIKNASVSEDALSFVKNSLDKISNTVTSKKVFSSVTPTGAEVVNTIEEERKSWSWSDWSKKDAKGLENMDKTVRDALYNKEFKKP